MLADIFSLQNSRNWVYVLLKVVMVVAFTALLFLLDPPTNFDFQSISYLVYPAIIGLVSALIVSIVTLIKPIKKYVPFMVIIMDWVLVAAYVYFLPNANDYLLLIGLTIAITVSGIMHVGALFGVIEAIGSLIALVAAYAIRPDVNFDAIVNDPTPFLPILFIAIVMFVISIVWHAALDEENSSSRKEVRQEIETSRKRLDDMRERTRSVAEMAAQLNTSLNFDSILDASLDIGRMSVYESASSRIVSMALMVTSDEGEMTITKHRGLKHTERQHKFTGDYGMIATAMNKGEPIIFDGGADDPELGIINSFALIKSTLIIPLRAGYETYGVLVFGSTARNAINEDHIDTLAAIGVQATVALQNAVLYNNLRDEKERILRIEENGRKALVRDLHDIPTQTVSAVAMHLSTITTIAERYPERLKDEVENIRGMALRATEELRHVMFTIRPLSLESSGLTPALNQLADKMENTYKQPMQVKVDERIEGVLDKDAKGSLFYLIEEAANNARKYAEASMIQVQVGIQGNAAIVRIRDNGRGFDMGAVGADYENRGSFGMVNMRERAELINGTFELQSAVGKGTLVSVRVPLDDNSVSVDAPVLKPRKPLRKEYTGPLSPSA